jgi:hypothetical protein
VPTFNRFLCWYCWKEASYIEHALPYEVEQELNEQDRDFANFDTDYIEPGPVTVYSSKDYTQDELQSILKS